eukprot:CAMPEP_0172530088 /NCGR_PEP_ID=MMETSP1067-20121228/3939_1 /TAXON_ID=265564 ORGANISM="Thalassiosira punctigera, Strain Tpunct2005C2" /NCGR_SAMPLE_ID=MMETSP1067 /ASSEMBLY_ACC=CAM_ASM_000444 /LENGTH=203 /DNA_ID=CAMNT_0013314233 /DNA_START=105 /DNA_END=716 /DNA_ORIENTATION=+
MATPVAPTAASSAPMSVDPADDDAAAPPAIAASHSGPDAATTATIPAAASDDRDDDRCDDDDDDDDDEADKAPAGWDEGGRSHCGYSETVHDALMSIGESIHRVVGEPGEGMHGAMRGIGNWFQEASYAARDLRRGKMDVAGETAAAMKSVVSGDEDDDDKEGEGLLGEARTEEEEEEEGGLTKLEPVKEDATVCTDKGSVTA